MNKPVRAGSVTFVSTEGQPTASASITEEGTYKVPRITAGEYKVCVETDSVKPKKAQPGLQPGANTPKGEKLPEEILSKMPEGYRPSNPGDAAMVEANRRSTKLYVEIPPSFAKPETTPLGYTVVGGEQEFNIEVK